MRGAGSNPPVPIGLQAYANRDGVKPVDNDTDVRPEESTARVSLRDHEQSFGAQIVDEIQDAISRRVDRKLRGQSDETIAHDRKLVELIVRTVLPVALDAAHRKFSELASPPESDEEKGGRKKRPPPQAPSTALFAVKTALFSIVLSLAVASAGALAWLQLDTRTQGLEARAAILPDVVRFSLALADYSAGVSEDNRELLRRIAQGLNDGTKIDISDIPERTPPKPPVSLRRIALESEPE